MTTENFKKNERGFIKIILIVIGVLVALKYAFKLDVIDFLTQGTFKDFLDKFYSLGNKGWHEYREVMVKIWNHIVKLFNIALQKLK